MTTDFKVGQLFVRTRLGINENEPLYWEIFCVTHIDEFSKVLDLRSRTRDFVWTSNTRLMSIFWEPYRPEIELPKGGDWE